MKALRSFPCEYFNWADTKSTIWAFQRQPKGTKTDYACYIMPKKLTFKPTICIFVYWTLWMTFCDFKLGFAQHANEKLFFRTMYYIKFPASLISEPLSLQVKNKWILSNVDYTGKGPTQHVQYTVLRHLKCSNDLSKQCIKYSSVLLYFTYFPVFHILSHFYDAFCHEKWIMSITVKRPRPICSICLATQMQ